MLTFTITQAYILIVLSSTIFQVIFEFGARKLKDLKAEKSKRTFKLDFL